MVVLCADSYCPHNCEPGSDKPGYLVELVAAALADRGESYRYQIEPWERAIIETRAGVCDALVGTPSNEPADFIFPEEPAGMNINVFLTRSDNTWQFRGRESLDAIQLGGVAEYVYGDPVDSWIAAHIQDQNKVQLLSGETAIAQNLVKLRNGRITAFIEDRAVLEYRLHEGRASADFRFAGEVSRLPFHVAFSPAKPESAARAAALTQVIRRWDKSGKLAKLLARYGISDWKH